MLHFHNNHWPLFIIYLVLLTWKRTDKGACSAAKFGIFSLFFPYGYRTETAKNSRKTGWAVQSPKVRDKSTAVPGYNIRHPITALTHSKLKYIMRKHIKYTYISYTTNQSNNYEVGIRCLVRMSVDMHAGS